MDKIKLAFAADIVPTQTNEQYFIKGDIDYLFGDKIITYLEQVDFRCFNLEVALTNKKNTALYPGPHLIAKPETINAIKKLNPSLLTIGNNHALDQGHEGCVSTMSILSNSKIPFTGAGYNLKEAYKPYYIEISGVKFGFFNCSEYEFAAATENSCGVNPYDPLVSFDLVKQMKENCDIAIVLYHGGKEFYRYPSPQVQKVCRKFVECGASLVICQHTHCIGCEEKYGSGTIIYGQGNFILDRNEDEYKKTGMFVELIVDKDTYACSVSYVPFYKCKECIRIAEENIKDDIMNDFYRRSNEILIPGFIDESYSRLADEYFERYIQRLIGHHKWIRIINRIMRRKLYTTFYNHKDALTVLNIISPENHSELFKAGLRNRANRTINNYHISEKD